MQHLHKFVLAALVALCLGIAFGGLAGCRVTEESLTPAQRSEAQEIKAADTAAQASGDPAAIAASEQAMADFESKVLMERAGPITTALSAVHPSLGWLTSLIPLAPLLGRRGRKHFWNAVKDVNPWAGKEDGAERGIAPIAALGDLARMWGLKHSSDASEAAANAPAAPASVGSPA